MHKIRGALVALFLFGVFFGAENAMAKSAGPVVSISDEEIKNDMKNEDGLKRLGDFGKLHFFGYGQAQYDAPIGPTGNSVDLHWITLGMGYDFTDHIKMMAEIDFEHAFQEPELEFAYVDFLWKSWANFRAGAVLIPMGVINEHHEPPLFYGVNRPEIYQTLIPTEWQGIGGGLYGQLPAGFDYQLYGLSSLNAASFNDDGSINQSFTGSEGFHDAHSIAEAPGRDFGLAGRLQYRGIQGLRLGTSLFVGNTGQGNGAIDGGFLTMVEGDAKYSFQGIDLEGMIAFSNLKGAGSVNNVLIAADPTFTDFVGSQMMGWYLQGAYHMFHHLMPDTKHDLVAFGRYEAINTQHKMPAGFVADPVNDRQSFIMGLSYMPIPQIAIKADYKFNWNKSNAGVDQLAFGVGYYF